METKNIQSLHRFTQDFASFLSFQKLSVSQEVFACYEIVPNVKLSLKEFSGILRGKNKLGFQIKSLYVICIIRSIQDVLVFAEFFMM